MDPDKTIQTKQTLKKSDKYGILKNVILMKENIREGSCPLLAADFFLLFFDLPHFPFSFSFLPVYFLLLPLNLLLPFINLTLVFVCILQIFFNTLLRFYDGCAVCSLRMCLAAHQ